MFLLLPTDNVPSGEFAARILLSGVAKPAISENEEYIAVVVVSCSNNASRYSNSNVSTKIVLN